jgi:hypothetical protein
MEGNRIVSELSEDERTMVMMKRFCIIGVLIVAAMLVQDAMALPSGTYVDDNEKNWSGYKSYNSDGFDVVLEWAVYEISSVNPWAQQVDFPDGDNFIYAYQIFNYPDTTKDVGFFSVLDIGGNAVAQTLMHATRSVADGAGIMSDPNPSTTQGEWKWTPGVGFVSAQNKSAFLIFSSVYGPTKGSFVIRGPEEEEPPVPEPGTLALFGVASGLFLAKRTRKRQSQ